jgi:hypothetical protein
MTLPLVLFPAAPTAVKTYLDAQLDDYGRLPYVDGVVVDTTSPKPIPAVFVFIELVGGIRTLVSVKQPRLEFTIWHQTDDDALLLGELVHALLHQMRGDIGGGVIVTRVVDVAGLFRSPSNRPRYRFAVEIGVHNIDLP